jgi:hypothetical protein
MARRIAFVVVAAVAVLAASACTPARPLYHLDEPAGSTTVDDANDVVDGRATNVTFGQPGKTGTAARFNGTSSIIRIPNNAAMNPGSGDFSVTVSVRFSVLPGSSTFDVVRKGIDGDGGYWKLELFNASGSARARCLWRDNAGHQTSLVQGSGLQNNAWHTITCALQGDETRMTVDGKTKTNTPDSPIGTISNTRETTIGAQPNGGDWYNGLVDEVRFD